jgi:hypothetical protein
MMHGKSTDKKHINRAMVPKKWEDIGKEIRCDDNHD